MAHRGHDKARHNKVDVMVRRVSKSINVRCMSYEDKMALHAKLIKEL